MTEREFIEHMMGECRMERGTVEDFLNAQRDVVIALTNKKERVPLPGLGAFEPVNGAERPVRWHFSKKIYPLLNIRPKILLEKCVDCKETAPLKGARRCRPCMTKREKTWRKPRRQEQQRGSDG